MGISLTRAFIVGALACSAFAIAATRSGSEVQACGAAGPFDFDTFESEAFVPTYNRAIERASEIPLAAGTNLPGPASPP